MNILVTSLRRFPRDRYAAVLAGLFAAVMGLSVFGARDLSAWLIENALLVLVLPYLVLTYRRLPLSRFSYSLIFVFLCLHEVGAHWTYARVPIPAWGQALTHGLFGDNRNYYDRLVHFSYGLLIAYPIREIFLRVADVRGFWGYFLPLDVMMSTSMAYELLEWLVADVFTSNVGTTFLATQGDPWDAQKDMACATGGAIVALVVTALVNYRCQRDFAREFSASLKVKHPAPLGEEALARLYAASGR